jgi:predicted secreted hydrolase
MYLTAMKMFLLFAVVLLLLVPPSSADDFRCVNEHSRPALPRDFFYRKDYRIQWWYFTGHLYDSSGREFGYELTFFVVGMQRRTYRSRFGADNIYISHFALTDVNNRKYFFAEKTDSGAFGFSGAEADRLKTWVDGNILEGTTKRMHIRASAKGNEIDFILTPLKPVVLNGEGGYSRKSEESPDFASLYFSYTDLKTEGTLRLGGSLFPVRGTTWFDRELSSKGLSPEEAGWDWFSIQLDDDREIMLYLLRKKDATFDRSSSGTFVYQDGTYRHLSLNDFSVRVLGHYQSKKTGANYPSGWDISIPSEKLSLRIAPLVEDQEFLGTRSTGNYYWEGACMVKGRVTGRAYVELTGY